MNKHLIPLGIVVLLICIGLSGCTDGFFSPKDENICKPQMSLTEEDYKNNCNYLESYEITMGDKVVINETILKIVPYGSKYDIFELGGKYSNYVFLYAVTDENHSYKKGDYIRIWGECIDFYPFDTEEIEYLFKDPLVWAFFIDRLYINPWVVSDKSYQKLYELIDLRNPTYNEVVQFVGKDNTEEYEYTDTFVCSNFTYIIIENARKEGYIADEVTLFQTEEEFFDLGEANDAPPSHSIVCFNTSDRGLYFVEPQLDTIVSKDEFKQMQNEGNYPYAEGFLFDHYTISMGIRMHFLYNYNDYSWDELQGAWIFNIDNGTYVIEDL